MKSIIPRGSATYKSIEAEMHINWSQIGTVLARRSAGKEGFIYFPEIDILLDQIADNYYFLGKKFDYRELTLRNMVFDVCMREWGSRITGIIKNDGPDFKQIQYADRYIDDIVLYAWKAGKDVPSEVNGWRKNLYSLITDKGSSRASRALSQNKHDLAKYLLLTMSTYAEKAEESLPPKISKMFEMLRPAAKKSRVLNARHSAGKVKSAISFVEFPPHYHELMTIDKNNLIAHTLYGRQSGLYNTALYGVLGVKELVSQGKLKNIPPAISKVEAGINKLRLESRIVFQS